MQHARAHATIAVLLFLLPVSFLCPQDAEYVAFGTARAGAELQSPLKDLDTRDDLLAWTMAVEAHHRYSAESLEARVDHMVFIGPDSLELEFMEAFLLARPIDWLDISLGMKRLDFGLPSLWREHDPIHPAPGSSGKARGFRGAMVRVSVGQELGLGAAVSLEPILAARTADPMARGLDKALMAARTDWQSGPFNIGAAWFWQGETTMMPLAWMSYDLGGIILGAEGSMNLDDPDMAPWGILRGSFAGSLDQVDLDLALEGTWHDNWKLGATAVASLRDRGNLSVLLTRDLAAERTLLRATLGLQTAETMDFELYGQWITDDSPLPFEVMAGCALVLQW